MKHFCEFTRRSVGVALLLTLACLIHRPVRAQSDPGSPGTRNDAALAEALFEQGRERLESGEVTEACALLEASNETDPAIGTALLLAHCYEQMGRTASAWALFREVEALAVRNEDEDRATIARVRSTNLDGVLSKVVVQLDARGRHSATSVRIGETEIPRASWGIPIPLDPGEQTVVASAPGHESYEARVDIPRGGSVTDVYVPRLVPMEADEAAPALTAQPGNSSPGMDSAPDENSIPSLAYVSGGVGMAAFATSGILAALAQGDYDTSLQNCRTERLCSAKGVDYRERAEDKARGATIAAVVGAGFVGVALGLVLFTSDGGSSEAAAQLEVVPGRGGATLLLEATF